MRFLYSTAMALGGFVSSVGSQSAFKADGNVQQSFHSPSSTWHILLHSVSPAIAEKPEQVPMCVSNGHTVKLAGERKAEFVSMGVCANELWMPALDIRVSSSLVVMVG